MAKRHCPVVIGTKCIAMLVASLFVGGVAEAKPYPRELRCLADIIYLEARGEPFVGRLAVAHVVLNRRDFFQNPSVCALADMSGQFASRRSISASMRSSDAWKFALEIARVAYADRDGDPTGGATHFHATYLTNLPRWSTTSWSTVSIGGHHFFRLEGAD